MKSKTSAQLIALAAIVSWLVLAVTGVFLHFEPRAVAAYSDMEQLRSEVTFELWMSRLHVWVAIPAAVLPVAALVAHFAHRRWLQLVGWATGAVAMAASYYSGRWLPWDSMSLWALTAGTRMRGFNPRFGSNDMTFQLFDGTEMSTGSIVFWYRIHTAVVPAILAIVALTMIVGPAIQRRRALVSPRPPG